MSATEEIDMSNELKPPDETGGGLIMWMLGAIVVAFVIVALVAR